MSNTTGSDAMISVLSIDQMRECLQDAGYRVQALKDESAGVRYLRSATGGMPFDVRLGNRIVDSGEECVDVALVTMLQVEGILPLGIVDRWNGTRRFARLHGGDNVLVLTMDISAAGGVSPMHVRGQIEVWDRLVHDLIGYLRHELSAIAVNGRGDTVVPERTDVHAEAAPA